MLTRFPCARVCVIMLLSALVSASSLIAQTFSSTGSMPTAMAAAQTVLLQDGTVLLLGGLVSGKASSLAMIYNPQTKTFSYTNGPMTTVRSGAAVMLLNSGEVLVAGGSNGTSVLSSAELYNPATGTFTLTGSMTAPQSGFPTLLNDGTVLICGGVGASYTITGAAQIYNPTTGTFSATGSMIHARSNFTATLLMNGSVLIAGGGSSTQLALNSAEIYVPAAKQFSPVGNLVDGRWDHYAALLTDGTVLIAGGFNASWSAIAQAEIYNPVTLSFSATGSLNTARGWAAMTPLLNGTVLIAGGSDNSGNYLASAEVYNPSLKTFSYTGNMTMTRAFEALRLLSDGSILVASGLTNGVYTPTAEVYTYPFTSGALNPKYIVLGVIYAPPGAKSSVTYGQTTALGTSSSVSDTFTTGVNVTTSAGIYLGGSIDKIPWSASGSVTVSKTWTQEADSSSTYTVNQTTSAGNGADGPLSSAIGVDHDYDTVLVWLNPRVNMTVGPVTTTLLWNGYAFNSADPYFTGNPDVVQLSIFCLKNPFFAPGCTDNNYRTSRSWDTSGMGGLTLTDYQTIASRDPFYVNPSYDPNSDPLYRFTNTGNVALYTPAPPGDGPYFWTGGWNYVATAQDGEGAEDKYEVDFTVDAKLQLIIGGELKKTTSTTWDNKWSATQTYSVGQSAQYSIYGPVATDNYSGPTAFEVWQDNVYGTFMFVAPGTQPTSPGSIGVSPASLSFGTVKVGTTSSAQQLTLTNKSTLPIFMGNPSAFPFTGTTTALSPVWAFSDPSFSVVSGSDACTGKIVSPNSTCTLSVQFAPTQVGADSQTLYLTGVTDAVVLATVPLSGTGD